MKKLSFRAIAALAAPILLLLGCVLHRSHSLVGRRAPWVCAPSSSPYHFSGPFIPTLGRSS
ncbi:MAG: hypothetical protein JO170_11225 [Verrucomicrobia bacterium]|nr:hypothetical protein [Verrucomicrobiota bacterium]